MAKLHRAGEVKALFPWVLAIEEARLGGGDAVVHHAVQELTICFTQPDREDDADSLFPGASAIKEVGLETEDEEVAHILHELAECLNYLDRAGEVESLPDEHWRSVRRE